MRGVRVNTTRFFLRSPLLLTAMPKQVAMLRAASCGVKGVAGMWEAGRSVIVVLLAGRRGGTGHCYHLKSA